MNGRLQKALEAGWAWIPPFVFVLSFAVSGWSFRRHFEGGLSLEFCHYAEIGRNIVEGRGFVSRVIYPATAAYLDEKGIPWERGVPVLERFPLHAWLSAAAQRALGSDDAAVAALSALLLAACAALTSIAGLWLWGPVEGLAAGSLFALDPSFQRGFVLWGLPDFGFCFFTFLAAFIASRPWPQQEGQGPREHRADACWAAAGAVAGLAWMERANFVLWLPLFLWTARRRRAAGWLCAGFLLASFPALAYSLRWYGLNPPNATWNMAYHVLVDTPPWLSYRVFHWWEPLRHPFLLARKSAGVLARELFYLPTWWQAHLLFPFAVWGAWKSRSKTAGRLAALIGAMLAIQLPAFSLFRYETLGASVAGRYYLWLAPALFLFAARGAGLAAERLRRPAALGAALLGAVNALFFCVLLAGPQGPSAHPLGWRVRDWPELAATLRATREDEWVATNLPGQVAWYAGRPAIDLPSSPEELEAIAAKHRVGAILLSSLPVGELDKIPAWRPLLAPDPSALRAFCKRIGFKPWRGYGTSIILVRSRML